MNSVKLKDLLNQLTQLSEHILENAYINLEHPVVTPLTDLYSVEEFLKGDVLSEDSYTRVHAFEEYVDAVKHAQELADTKQKTHSVTRTTYSINNECAYGMDEQTNKMLVICQPKKVYLEDYQKVD